MGLPVHAYLARDEIREDGTERSKKVFVNLPTEVSVCPLGSWASGMCCA